MKKKLISALLALALLILSIAATASLAEEPAPRTFMGGIQFNMDMEQVMEIINLPDYEIEEEKNRGNTEFWELEYEDVKGEDDLIADITFLFVGNSLVAFHYDMAEGTSYDDIRNRLAESCGALIPFDASKIGNGKYAIDGGGDLKDCTEMVEIEGLTIVLEKDRDGDVEITFLDMTAAYINA